MATFGYWLNGAPLLNIGGPTGDFAYWFANAPVLILPEQFAITRDEALPLEIARAVIRLNRDEALPVETSVTAPLFVFLNWLGGGAGVLPEPVLASERGLAHIWWTGWSQSRWSPAPQIPMVVGVLPPRPRRVVAIRPAPARRHREASRATGIWGGRSRYAFTPGPEAIAAENEDLIAAACALLS